MRIFAALVWREVFERRLLLLASAFLSLVPIAVPWIPGGPERFSPQDLRTVTIEALVLLFGAATLLILGSTIVGRDASEGRLGFYFSRPISSLTLWLSRIVAAASLLFTSLLLLITPTAVLDFDAWVKLLAKRGGERAWPLLGGGEIFSFRIWDTFPELPEFPVLFSIYLTAVLILLVATHAVSTIVRGRSAWVLVDLAGLGLVVAIGWAARNIMVREEALGALVWSEWLLLPWMLGSLLLAGAAQLQRGRTDPALGHRWLSAVLWPTLIFGASSFLAYAHFIAAGRLVDLESLTFTRPSPDEQWLAVGGSMRHRARSEAAFLVEIASGESWRLASLGMVRAWLTYADDSSRVAWLRCASGRPLSCQIWSKDLHNGESPPQPTDIPVDKAPLRIVLSTDGSRLAFAESERIAVYDLSSGHLLAATTAKDPMGVTFSTPNRVRFREETEAAQSRLRLSLRELDIERRQVVEVGRAQIGYRETLNPHGRDEFFLGYSPSGVSLFDREGRQLPLELDERWQMIPYRGYVLADGRLVLILRDSQTLALVVVSSEGQQEHLLEFRDIFAVRLGGELPSGHVVIAFNQTQHTSPTTSHWPGVAPLTGWTTYLLDIESGELAPWAAGGVPLGTQVIAGPRLFLAGGKAVVQWHPDTDEHRTLVGPFESTSHWRGNLPWQRFPPYDD